MLSMQKISHPCFSASRRLSAVFPLAVGPVSTRQMIFSFTIGSS